MPLARRCASAGGVRRRLLLERAVLDAVLPVAGSSEPVVRDWRARMERARAEVAQTSAFGGAIAGALAAATPLLWRSGAGPAALAGAALAALVAVPAAGPVGFASRAVATTFHKAVSSVARGEQQRPLLAFGFALGWVGAVAAGVFLLAPYVDSQSPLARDGTTRAVAGGLIGLLDGWPVGVLVARPVELLVEALAWTLRVSGRFVVGLARPAKDGNGVLERARSGSVGGALVGALVCAAGLAVGALDGPAASAAVAGCLAGSLAGGVVGAVVGGKAGWHEVWLDSGMDPPSDLRLLWAGGSGLPATPGPTFRFRDGLLHARSGAAVRLPWREVYCWRGRLLNAEAIRSQPDPLERRAMLACYGVGRYLRELGAVLVHEDGCGRLWRGRIFASAAESTALAVEVEDATSGEQFLLRVPPGTESAREGVAWSFGLLAEEYLPAVEA